MDLDQVFRALDLGRRIMAYHRFIEEANSTLKLCEVVVP